MALELTDDLGGTLKCILKKREKLDIIGRAVKNIEGNLDKLEERTTRHEALEKSARDDIDDLKTNYGLLQKNHGDAKKSLDKKIKNLEGRIGKLQGRNKHQPTYRRS